MAKVKVDNKLNVVIGTKAQIEGDTNIPEKLYYCCYRRRTKSR